MTPAQFNEYQRQAEVIEQHKKWKESQDMALQNQSESKAIPELSDEEIEKAGKEYFSQVIGAKPYELFAWISACEWYREQLKQRQ